MRGKRGRDVSDDDDDDPWLVREAGLCQLPAHEHQAADNVRPRMGVANWRLETERLRSMHTQTRPLHARELERKRYETLPLVYGVDPADTEDWVHCSAFLSEYSIRSLFAVTLPLGLESFQPEFVPVSVEMRCGTCEVCTRHWQTRLRAYDYVIERNVEAVKDFYFARSTLWARGIAMLMCPGRHAQWVSLRYSKRRWWRACCALLCREFAVLNPARHALLHFGDTYFPVLPPLLEVLERK